MPRRYKQGADGQPHPAFYGKLPEEFSKADTMRFMVETDLKLSGCVSADTLAALRAEGYDYKDGNLVPAGKEETMQEKVANTTPAAPLKLDVSVRVIEPVKNLMGFASVKFNDCFVVENLKIVQGSKGLFLGMPSQPDGKGGYRDMAYPVTKEFREQLNTAVLQAYEAKLEQMAERGSVGRAVHQRAAQSRKSGCRTSKGRTASEGKAQPQRRALTSGHAGPKQKGGGNHATQTDGL
ncbi:septation protein SpoVG family protein [Clostridioides difficile]